MTQLRILVAEILGLKVAGFATGAAVVQAVFTEAHVLEALAKAAEPYTIAATFRKVANGALKQLRHKRRLARFPGGGQYAVGVYTFEALATTLQGRGSYSGSSGLKSGSSRSIKARASAIE